MEQALSTSSRVFLIRFHTCDTVTNTGDPLYHLQYKAIITALNCNVSSKVRAVIKKDKQRHMACNDKDLYRYVPVPLFILLLHYGTRFIDRFLHV